MQFSLAEDGQHADIDVDYRSSRSPQSLFNGHLTASNSDVRAGENPTLHNAALARTRPLVAGRVRQAEGGDAEAGGPARTGSARQRADTAPARSSDERRARSDRGRRAGVPHRLAGPAPVRPGARDALVAILCVRGAQSRGARRAARRGRLPPRAPPSDGYATQKLGPRPDLTSAIVAFTPRDPNRPILDHAFRRSSWSGWCLRRKPGSTCATRLRRLRCRGSVLRRHLHVPDRRRRNAGAAVDARGWRVEDRVVPAARTIGAGTALESSS